ncbi:Leucine-rich repeat receptor-like protein kinase PXC1 [Dichanthelium oligosanthes]|uniref:Leucine-rich repeat receptor-like protein kinase PXC1 n=1 Tax=Dichanthelium oligosanthes TaxID=888268 RepID=A0A1E5V411_9POAL|nr:Leucine-rich repeat receptor-like protein kinase PXC1 [Dichanthelium oligosanthes]
MNGSKCDQRRRWRLWRWAVVSCLLVTTAVVEAGGAEVTELDYEERRDERRDLLVLRDTLRSALDLHSNWTGPPCHGAHSRWRGVSCDGDGRVVGVALDGAQLTGSLPTGALRGVSRLQALSLRGNALHGALPGLDALPRLRAVDLSSNRFSGPIPRRYATSLRDLARLELQDNLLNGTLPAFQQRGLVVFNVSYNFLQGEVPDTRALRRFPTSAFDHNLRLCGEAVNAECREGSPSFGAPAAAGGSSDDPAVRPAGDRDRAARKPMRFRLATWSVVVMSLIAALVPFAAVLIFLHHKKKGREIRLGGRAGAAETVLHNAKVTGAGDIKDKAEQGPGSGSRSTDSGKGAELHFFLDDRGRFELDELFRSTAEMLGKGRLGITYRVTLEAGPVVVVKRLRNMSHVPRRDFTHTMQLLGKLRHENVADLLACFYSKEEKLVVYEHVPGCSLFQLLHGNRGEGRTPLPWPARLSIAQGVARGLAYLHQSLPYFHRPPHGNLKSSNVLVFFAAPAKGTQQQQKQAVPKLTDHGFHPLLPHHAHRLAAAKCPEFARGGGRRLSSRADVYCLGVVLLELLTGKVPVEEDGDLAEWARLALSHEWSTDILDVEIVGDRGRHGDMLRLTEVALLCAAVEPDRRPKVQDVVRMIDEIAAGDGAPELAAGR